MPCECVLAGYCERHKVRKCQEWVALCQSRPEYFSLWESGRGPGHPIDPQIAINQVYYKFQRDQTTRALWAELHAEQHATQAWLASWVSRVPSFGCGCRAWLRDYLVTNPPRYDDWFAWTVELHNAVNRKISHAEITLAEAKAIWRRELEYAKIDPLQYQSNTIRVRL